MIRVYIMSVAPLSDPALCAEAAQKAGAQRRERARRIKRSGDRQLCLGAGVLLGYAVRKYRAEAGEKRLAEAAREKTGGKSLSEAAEAGEKRLSEAAQEDFPVVCACVQVGEVLRETDAGAAEEAACRLGIHGKPYLQQYPDIYISLSHSGIYALCAVSDREVGADIQRWQETGRTDRVARRCFTPEELEWYRKANSEPERMERFCRLWTAREAYMKLTGEGLLREMKSFSVDLRRKAIRNMENGHVCACLYEPAAPEGYGAAVCVFAARGTVR